MKSVGENNNFNELKNVFVILIITNGLIWLVGKRGKY